MRTKFDIYVFIINNTRLLSCIIRHGWESNSQLYGLIYFHIGDRWGRDVCGEGVVVYEIFRLDNICSRLKSKRFLFLHQNLYMVYI